MQKYEDDEEVRIKSEKSTGTDRICIVMRSCWERETYKYDLKRKSDNTELTQSYDEKDLAPA